jgi:putative ABC transport system permease protein
VRLALGADVGSARWFFAKAAWAAGGQVAGTAAALWLSRFVQAMLFNVGARDPLTFAAVAVLLGVVAIVATALPAIRAVHVDPMLALRSE